MKKFFIISLTLTVLLAVLIFPTAKSYAQGMQLPQSKVLQDFKAKGGEIEFLGNALGMDGWVVMNPEGRVQYVYTNKEGALIIGMMFNAQGDMETMKQIKTFRERAAGGQGAIPGAEKSDAVSKSEKFYADVEKANWVSLGNGDAPYIYAFINTHCAECIEYWQTLSGYVKDGKLQIRAIPWGNEKDNHAGGAALLSQQDPYNAWLDHAAGNKDILSAKNASKEGYAKIKANNELIKKWPISITPFTIYRKVKDGTINALLGKPENPLLILADMIKPQPPAGTVAEESAPSTSENSHAGSDGKQPETETKAKKVVK